MEQIGLKLEGLQTNRVFMIIRMIMFFFSLFVFTSFALEVGDLPQAEYLEHMEKYGGGLKLPTGWKEKVSWFDIAVRNELPASFDKRVELKVQVPVKRQRCGDCWAHSTLSMYEYAWQLKNQLDPAMILSQQEMISRCGGTGGSCNGGWFIANNYVVKKPGVPLEEDLPYKGYTTKCNHEVKKEPRGISWAMIGDKMRGPTIEQIKQALMDSPGNISVDLHAFSHEGSDVYTRCSSGRINHMTNIVGWQDDPQYNGGGYWIMLNSWGKGFGEDGFARVAYKDSRGRKCSGVGTDAAMIVSINK
jgi:C1A family cysteine protease